MKWTQNHILTSFRKVLGESNTETERHRDLAIDTKSAINKKRLLNKALLRIKKKLALLSSFIDMQIEKLIASVSQLCQKQTDSFMSIT